MKRSFDSWDIVSLNNYSSELLRSDKWFETANEITAAMALLEPHLLAWWQSMREWSRSKGKIGFREHSFAGIYMMLAGFAVENFCKGHDVQDLTFLEREQVRTKGELPKRLHSHNLVQLVSRTGLAIDPAEEELLQRLTRAVFWFGRYPVPRNHLNRDRTRLKSGKVHSTSWIGSTDLYRTKALIQRPGSTLARQSLMK